jgi:hypothetical protein
MLGVLGIKLLLRSLRILRVTHREESIASPPATEIIEKPSARSWRLRVKLRELELSGINSENAKLTCP